MMHGTTNIKFRYNVCYNFILVQLVWSVIILQKTSLIIKQKAVFNTVSGCQTTAFYSHFLQYLTNIQYLLTSISDEAQDIFSIRN